MPRAAMPLPLTTRFSMIMQFTPRMFTRRLTMCVCAAVLLASCARPSTTTPASPAPARPQQGTPGAEPDSDTSRAAPAGRGAAGPAAPRPYNRVITAQAKTRDGLFKAHRIGDRLLYEIPRRELDKDFLLVTQIAKTVLGSGYGGQALGNRVLRWERRDNRILLRTVSYSIVADSSLPIAQAVAAANYDPIIMAFNVEAWGPDSAAVIDVSRLFTTDVAEFSGRTRVRGRQLDASRSFIERVASFPDNIEVEASHTYAIGDPNFGMQTGPRAPNAPAPVPPGTATVLMHWSMVRLPENQMMPRLYDDRVGYFSVRQQDFGRDEHRAPQRRYITRWRLEKKDPGAAVSEPVKPIVYYVDPATPAKWVPYVKAGIEDWQPAFEAAGFRRAIIAADAPSPEQDPDWSAEDARYSVVRWLPSTIENAMGPHVHDPRTGEILESDIQMYHNVLNLQRAWYFVQVGALDSRARKLPLPDSLMGRLLQYVVAHEVGHTLGFQHNMKASSMYPADSVRSRAFVAKYRHTPTLMDYSRFNYVAQPEDSIPLADLIPDIGPYDIWATKWGYAPVPGARTPDDERPTLDRWAREQDDTPWLRFSTSGSGGADPGELTEAVGDADAVKSTTYGLRNIKRTVPMLAAATIQEGQNNDDLRELYDRLVGQWATELNHVAAVVGGVQSQEKYGGQEGARFVPLPRSRQAAAVAFLNEHAFATPEFFLDTAILRRIEPAGAIERIVRRQAQVLSRLLDDQRMVRLAEFEALATNRRAVYTLTEMLGDVRTGIWSELSNGGVAIDAFRRQLQRAYLDIADQKINRPVTQRIEFTGGELRTVQAAPGGSDVPALLRGELKSLDASLRSAIPRARDRVSKLHMEASRERIAKILNPDA